jgi:hypothetical protein
MFYREDHAGVRFLLLFSHRNDGATPSMSFYRETHPLAHPKMLS